jgi:hypothetical protein
MFLWRAVLLLCASARGDDDDDYEDDTANWFENDGATTFNGYADAFAAPAQRPRAGRLTVVVASYACPWDYGPYSQQLRELAGYWADQHDVVWVGLSGKAKNTQRGAERGTCIETRVSTRETGDEYGSLPRRASRGSPSERELAPPRGSAFVLETRCRGS